MVDNILSIYDEYIYKLDNMISKNFTTDIKEINNLLEELREKIRKVKNDESKSYESNNN